LTKPEQAEPPPLDGITVVDFTRVLSGPYCTMLLGDMGARVIKIEQPGRGDDTRAWGPPFVAGESAYFLSVNRNKESVTLDLKHPAAAAVVQRLLDRADVVIENFRPGTMDRLGFGHEEVARRWPRIVYCSISGFGQTGPRRNEAGYDAIAQAEGGLMSITGEAAGAPYRLGVAISDIVTGMFAAQGILLALLARARSGRGQRVDVALLDATAALLTYQASYYFATGTPAGRMGNQHPTIAPYDTFPASDGELVLAIGNDQQWVRFCGAAGLDDLAREQRFATNASRVEHYAALRTRLVEKIGARSRAEWIASLKPAGVPCGSVRDVAEALSDPQLAAREMIAMVDHAAAGHLRVLGLPVKLSSTPGRIRSAPPVLGQNTDAVLVELGLSEEDVRTLRSSAAV
jgi:crotonobetainyl-CoA:carnitine CoA-transferase CaiB-like acyl-CoA transferase